jgi:hypothetical protein
MKRLAEAQQLPLVSLRAAQLHHLRGCVGAALAIVLDDYAVPANYAPPSGGYLAQFQRLEQAEIMLWHRLQSDAPPPQLIDACNNLITGVRQLLPELRGFLFSASSKTQALQTSRDIRTAVMQLAAGASIKSAVGVGDWVALRDWRVGARFATSFKPATVPTSSIASLVSAPLPSTPFYVEGVITSAAILPTTLGSQPILRLGDSSGNEIALLLPNIRPLLAGPEIDAAAGTVATALPPSAQLQVVYSSGAQSYGYTVAQVLTPDEYASDWQTWRTAHLAPLCDITPGLMHLDWELRRSAVQILSDVLWFRGDNYGL